MIKITRILRNGWFIGVCTSLIAALFIEIINRITSLNIYHLIFNLLFILYGFLKNVLNFKITLGELIIIVFLAYILLKLALKRHKPTPIFLNYTNEVFHGVSYRWEYLNKSNQYTVSRITPFCPDCFCEIVHNECQICGRIFLDVRDKEQVEAMIRHGINTKYGIDDYDQIRKS